MSYKMRFVSSLEPRKNQASSLIGKARRIIKNCQKEGVVELEKATCGKGLDIPLEITEKAADFLSEPVRVSLERIVRIQEKIALKQYETLRPSHLKPTAGIKITQNVKRLEKMAVSASGVWGEEIPESLASILISARIAGVPDRILLLKPDENGGISPVSLYTAGLAEATKIFRAGGNSGMVALQSGFLGKIPDKHFLVGGDRIERTVYQELCAKHQLPVLDLAILLDSKSSIEPVIEMMKAWVQDEPDSAIQLFSTSKRVINRIQNHLENYEINNEKEWWWPDFKKIPIMMLETSDDFIDVFRNCAVRYMIMLIEDSDKIYNNLTYVDHAVSGDVIPSMISKRVLSAGVINSDFSNSSQGVFAFLRTSTFEKIGTQAGNRLKNRFSILDRLDL
jgi:histidinol dehydrogenase